MNDKKLWIWRWSPDGYNYCTARDREEALEIARNMIANTNLSLREETLHEGTWEELDRLETSYGGFGD